MPPKPTPEKAAKYKNRGVSAYGNPLVEEEIKQLPDDLKESWSKRNFKEFLEKALKKLENGGYKEEEELSNSLLVILPTLASSDEEGVHELIQTFYATYTHEDVGNFTHSMYEYVFNTVGMERSKLVPSDWIEEVMTKPLNREILRGERKLKAETLTHVRKILIDFPKDDAGVKAELTLNVEAEFAKKCRETPPPPEGSILLNIAADLVQKFRSSRRFFKLSSKDFPKCPGVYFLYFLGEQELYEKSHISGSIYQPVYVGMSTTDISRRLNDHQTKIVQANDLNVADFAVNVMLLDNKHYAPCIEGMLIEKFKPIWNKETVGLCFGVGEQSLWKKIHVDQDVDSINELLGRLQVSSSKSESSDDDDDDDDDDNDESIFN